VNASAAIATATNPMTKTAALKKHLNIIELTFLLIFFLILFLIDFTIIFAINIDFIPFSIINFLLGHNDG